MTSCITVLIKLNIVLQFSPGSSYSSSQVSSTTSDFSESSASKSMVVVGENYPEKLARLRSMFPGTAKYKLENILCQMSGDVEKAIDRVIDENNKAQNCKYCWTFQVWKGPIYIIDKDRGGWAGRGAYILIHEENWLLYLILHLYFCTSKWDIEYGTASP